jgi:hypothetical protein
MTLHPQPWRVERRPGQVRRCGPGRDLGPLYTSSEGATHSGRRALCAVLGTLQPGDVRKRSRPWMRWRRPRRQTARREQPVRGSRAWVMRGFDSLDGALCDGVAGIVVNLRVLLLEQPSVEPSVVPCHPSQGEPFRVGYRMVQAWIQGHLCLLSSSRRLPVARPPHRPRRSPRRRGACACARTQVPAESTISAPRIALAPSRLRQLGTRPPTSVVAVGAIVHGLSNGWGSVQQRVGRARRSRHGTD